MSGQGQLAPMSEADCVFAGPIVLGRWSTGIMVGAPVEGRWKLLVALQRTCTWNASGCILVAPGISKEQQGIVLESNEAEVHVGESGKLLQRLRGGNRACGMGRRCQGLPKAMMCSDCLAVGKCDIVQGLVRA